MAFLAKLVASYLFEKSKTILNRTTYHGIYRNESMLVFKGKKMVQEIKYWLEEFQQKLDKAEGNQHLQFTAEIWANNTYSPPFTKKDKVQIVARDELHFLDVKSSCPP